MAFDAGTILAHLDIDLDAFDKKLKSAEARADAAERKEHKIRLSAVFDDADLPRAKKAFADLDNQISRDAMQRLKSSPQGSVLGALNMLFSPHQIAGAPTAQQSLSQGALGKLAGASGDSGTSTANQNVRQRLISNLAGPAGAVQNIRQRIIGSLGQPGTVTEDVRQQLEGGVPGPGTVTEKVKPKLDPADTSKLTEDMGRAGDDAGRSFTRRFSLHLGALFASFGGGRGARGGISGGVGGVGGSISGLLGGIGPGIPGVSGLGATIAGGAGLALAALPAVGALTAGGGVAAGGAALLISQSKKLQDQAKSVLSGLEKTLTSAAAPLTRPLEQAFAQIPKFMASIAPALKSLFAGAAPLLKPMLDGLELLIKNLLPGLISLVKDAQPAFSMFAGVLGTLGHDLGQMFSDFSGAVGPSAVILKGLLDVVGGLLPVIGRVAAVLAAGLAPAFTVMAGAVKMLEPVLSVVGKIFAEFAGAVISDLASALGGLAQLVADLAPSFKILSQVLGQVFSTLENTGVFAILGDAIERLAQPLANVVNTLVKGLAPAIPPIVSVVGQLSGVLVTLISAGLGVMLNVLAKVISFLSPVLPLILEVVAAVKLWSIAQGLLDIAITANPIGLIVLAIAALIGAVVELVTHWKTVWGEVKSIAEDAWHFIWDGFGKFLLPLLGPVGLIALGAIELAQHWSAICGAIKDAAAALYQYLWSDFGQKIYAFFTQTIPHWMDVLSSDIDNIWNNIVSFFHQMPGRIINALMGLGSSLYSFASNAVQEFLNGAEAIGKKVISWFEGFGKGILGVVKKVLGVFSPSSEFRSIGESLIQGLLHGLQSGVPAVKGTVTALGTSVVGWIQQAMKATGTPLSWLAGMEKLVGFESGGNPNAINPQTAGSSGEHAEGIAQTIPSTFAAYSLGGSIFNPVADLIASMRYIKANYGSVYNIPGILSGVYGGYDSGGWLPPGATLAFNQTRGPEAVLTPSQSQAFIDVGEAARLFSRGMGGLGSSSLMRDVYLTLPEGTTIAQAMQEISFRLKVAQQQGFYGVVPG